MNTCPKCGAAGCGTVWREVKRVDGSDGYMNGEGVFIQHRREWTVTENVIEAESMTCLRRQLAAMTARSEAAESKLAEAARLAQDSARAAMELTGKQSAAERAPTWKSCREHGRWDDAVESGCPSCVAALRAEVVALKAKRICACGATVEELVIGEVTYRTNASSTNAKLMAEVSRLQAELEKPEPMVPLRVMLRQLDHIEHAHKQEADFHSPGDDLRGCRTCAAIRAAREGVR